MTFKKTIIAALLVLLFFSCGRKKDVNEKRTVFRYNEAAGITSLDPAFARDQANIWAVNQLFNGLVQLDENLLVQPCIAKSWSILDSGKTYSFVLRNDVFFHDAPCFPNGKGRKVIATDFTYSLQRLIDPAIASPGAWVLNVVNKKHSFDAPTDSTFIIHLTTSFSPFLGMMGMQYCSVVPREAIHYYKNEFSQHPIGTGPFYFKYWKEGVKLVLLKNQNYFEFENGTRLPYIDAVNVSFIIDKLTSYLEFIKGNLDMISGIDAAYKDELLLRDGTLKPKYRDRLRIASRPYLNTEYLGFFMDSTSAMMRDNPLRKKKVRQAINYAFDRKKMILYIRNNIGTPGLNGMVPPGFKSFSDQPTQGYNYNPAKARQLLKEAGYPEGQGMPEIALSTNNAYLDICKYLQQQLSEVGIRLKLDVNPPATHREMVANAKLPFFRGSWIADYSDPENYLSLFYSKNFTPQGPNYTHYKNIEYDKLYEKALATYDDSVRNSCYRQMDQMIMDDAAVLVFYYDQVTVFVRNWVENFTANPINRLDLKKVKKSKSA
ncbi:MAG: ABC transporter substrate-binding protein [Bacteroidota bacterium]